MFLLVIVTCFSEEEQGETLLSWVSGHASSQGTGYPVQGCGHTWHPLVMTHLTGLKAFLKLHSFKYTCSLFPCTSVNKAFCSYQAVPCNYVERLSEQHLSETAAEQAMTAGGMRNPCICFPLSARSPWIAWGITWGVHILLCTREWCCWSANSGPSALGCFLNSWGLPSHWPTHALSPNSPWDPGSTFALGNKCKVLESLWENGDSGSGPVTY